MKKVCTGIILGCLSIWACAQSADDIAVLETQKKAAQLIKDIEEAKASTATSRRNQLLSDSITDTSLADERKKQAEAEKAELAAKLPSTSSTALSGTVGVDGVKLLALGPIIQRLDAEAVSLCQVLVKDPGSVMMFDRSLIDGIIAARLLEKQLDNLKQSNERAIEPPPAGSLSLAPKSALLGVAAVTTGLKAVADLASLFKTNITTGKVDLAEAKSLFQTMVVDHCEHRVIAIPGSYLGELDNRALDAMIEKVEALLKARSTTAVAAEGQRKKITLFTASQKESQDAVSSLEKKGKDASDSEKQALRDEKGKLAIIKNQLDASQSILALLEETIKQTDAFILALKMTDTTGTGPLLTASRFLVLGKRIDATTRLLDVEVKAEGVTILKDNLFTGQKLRITGAAVLSYKILSLDGLIQSAKVKSMSADFAEIDLRHLPSP